MAGQGSRLVANCYVKWHLIGCRRLSTVSRGLSQVILVILSICCDGLPKNMTGQTGAQVVSQADGTVG